MIDINDLTHTVQYYRETDDEIDDYGQPSKSQVSKNEKCFFDFPKDNLYLSEDERKLNVDAVLFMHPDSDIQLDDPIISIKDITGTIVENKPMRVSAIRKANDDRGIHHLEVMLSAL